MRHDSTVATESTNRSQTNAPAVAPARDGSDGDAAERSKFDLGAPPVPFDAPIDLPWGYGDDRLCALVRSPDALYVYWEVTDPAIAEARRGLGAAGEWAWLNLRVYDTTGRAFDGTNAISYFDQTVERGAREWFFNVERPGSSCHVEIGLKSHEGYFRAIARSGRADFPRKGPSPNHSLEWMTVTSDRAHPTAQPYQTKYKGPPPDAWKPPPRPESSPTPRGAIVGGSHAGTRSYSWAHPARVDVSWEGPWVFDEWRTEWRVRWSARIGTSVGATHRSEWRVGPFPVQLLDPSRLEIRWLEGEPQLLEESTSGLEIEGPWEVKIHAAGSEPERRVLSTWRVHWIHVSPAHVERWWTIFERRRTGAWRTERVVTGASESHVLVETGASEAWRMAASERWAIGASAWLAMGGSEVQWLGASAAQMMGASALFYGMSSQRLGASEWLAQGASWWAGASETLGGSEGLGSGASWWLGSSEAHVGASERWSSTALRGGE